MTNYKIKISKEAESPSPDETYEIYQKFIKKLTSISKKDIFDMFNNGKSIDDEIMIINSNDITINNIIYFVTSYFKTDKATLLENKKSRRPIHLYPRQVISYYAYLYAKISLGNIGISIGGFDHATILHSYNVICNMVETDKNVRNDISNLNKHFIDCEIVLRVTGPWV